MLMGPRNCKSFHTSVGLELRSQKYPLSDPSCVSNNLVLLVTTACILLQVNPVLCDLDVLMHASFTP